MGGDIRVIYRQEDGVVHKRDRLTGSFVRYLKSHRIAERDHDWMMRYLDISERIDQSVEEEKTALPSAPSGYGIIVVDFMANQFLASQDYTELDRISPPEATGHFYHPEHRQEMTRNFVEMPDHRLHVRRRYYTVFQAQTQFREINEPKLTQSEAHIMAASLMRDYHTNIFRKRVDTMVEPETTVVSDFMIDFAPLYTYLGSDDATSLCLVRDRMKNTGFVFTNRDNSIWDTIIGRALNRDY